MPDLATGLLPLALLGAAVLCVPTCALLLWMYRRAVLTGMAALAGAVEVPSRGPVPDTTPPGRPLIQRVDAAAAPPPDSAVSDVFRRAVAAPWRAAAVYTGAGLTYAVLATIAAKVAYGLPGGWLQFGAQLCVVLWPGVLAALIVAPLDRRRRGLLLGAYFAALALIALLAGMRNPALGPLALPTLWLALDGPPTALVLTFLWRRIRAVGPMVIGLLVVATIGAQSLLWVWTWSLLFQRAVADAGSLLGLNALTIVIALVVGGLLAFVRVLGWPILRLVGRRYVAKRFNERVLTIDALFATFAFYQAVVYFLNTTWALSTIIAFCGYKATTRLGFRLTAPADIPGPTLLLLRVFRLGGRSERLFERLCRHWLMVGSVRMIAGPDLVSTTIDPHEFLEFVSGRLTGMFIVSAADLQRRLAELDNRPDPDGRYRINEFFCRGDTWQMTMRALAASSDTVLMDLRSFSAGNRGCLYEIGSLLDVVDLHRVVFIVDDTTDDQFLEASLHQLWDTASADSPNRGTVAPTARLLHVRAQSEGEVLNLLRHLLPRTARGLPAA